MLIFVFIGDPLKWLAVEHFGFHIWIQQRQIYIYIYIYIYIILYFRRVVNFFCADQCNLVTQNKRTSPHNTTILQNKCFFVYRWTFNLFVANLMEDMTRRKIEVFRNVTT
jgi:hypothetical protein